MLSIRKMKTLGIGFVGAGWMGSVQLKGLLAREDVAIKALVGTSVKRGEATLAELGLPVDLFTTEFESLLDNPEIDVIWLANPNGYHGAQAIAAMQAGKHVFCEKPAATSYDDFVTQIELEKAHPELITFVDYILYFDTMAERLRGMIANGDFGTLTQIQVNYRHPVNIQANKIWKLKREIMGDAIGMGIIHSLSTMVLLMASQAKPISVYATSMPAQVRGFEADPIWNIVIKFDNGATGFCFGNIDSGNGYDAYHNLYGTKGNFIFDSQLDRPQKVRYWTEGATGSKWVYPLDAKRCEKDGMDSLAWPAQTTTPDSGNVIEHQTGACIDHFMERVQNGIPSPLSFANSASIAELGWASQISAATNQAVALPLDHAQAQSFFFKTVAV